MPKSEKKRKTYGLFKPRESKKYAEIIKIDTVENAENSIELMEKEYNNAKTRSKKRGIIRRLNSASNIATVISNNPNVSIPKQKEKKKISKLYRESQKSLSQKYKLEFVD